MTKQAMALHWADDVADNDIAELHDIKTSIENCLIRAASSFVEIGRSLNRARVLIPGDLEFGQWREQMTPFTARQANNYMKIARKFTDHTLVAKTSMSVLIELSSAPKEMTQDVEKAIDDGKDVKRADVQQAKREGKTVDEVLEDRRIKEREKADKLKEKEERDAERFAIVDAEAAKAKEMSRDANNLASVSTSMRTTPPLVDARTGDRIPPEEENALPEGDYEMIAVTEDEFDLVIDALMQLGTSESRALAERLNQ